MILKNILSNLKENTYIYIMINNTICYSGYVLDYIYLDTFEVNKVLFYSDEVYIILEKD